MSLISYSLYLPVIRENWTLEDNLLQQLDQLVGEVGGHEGLDGDADVLRVLGLGQGGLDHLVNQRPPELVLVGQDLGKYFALLYNKTKSLKSPEMKEGWMTNDEWQMMKDEWKWRKMMKNDGWMMKDDGWMMISLQLHFGPNEG